MIVYYDDGQVLVEATGLIIELSAVRDGDYAPLFAHEARAIAAALIKAAEELEARNANR